MKTQTTHIKTVAPTAANNIAAGYNVGQWWDNTATGDKYYHKTDGFWVPVNHWIVKDVVPTSAVTGTISNVQIGDTIVIPANTFSANDILMMQGFGIEKTGTNGTCIWRFYHNTSNTLVGASQLCNATLTATQLSGNQRNTFEINGGLLKSRRNLAANFTDFVGASTVGTSISFNPTVTNYFFRAVTLGSALDSVISTQILISK